MIHEHRPYAVVIFEISQLILLGEPLWCAVQGASTLVLISTFVTLLVPVGIILLATHMRKKWARDGRGSKQLVAIAL